MDLLVNYIGFLLKAMTVVFSVIIILAAAAKFRSKTQEPKVRIKRLNEAYEKVKMRFLSTFVESGSGYAQQLLKEENVLRTDQEWTCSMCFEQVPNSFDLCWNCGTLLPNFQQTPITEDIASSLKVLTNAG